MSYIVYMDCMILWLILYSEKVYIDVRHIVNFVMQQFTIRNIGPYGDGVLFMYAFILSGVYRLP